MPQNHTAAEVAALRAEVAELRAVVAPLADTPGALDALRAAIEGAGYTVPDPAEFDAEPADAEPADAEPAKGKGGGK